MVFLIKKGSQEYVNGGVAKYEKGDINGAIDDYNKALDITPNFPEAYYNRGVCRHHEEDYDRAIVDYTNAIQTAGTYSAAHVNRGFCWQKKGEHDRAIDDFNKALAINPSDSFAYHNRGISWQQKEEYDPSIRDFNRAIELNPRGELSFYSRCASWTYKKEFKRALKDVEEAIRLRPDSDLFQEMASFLKARIDNEKKIGALYRRAEEDTRHKDTPLCGPYPDCDFVASSEEHILLASWGFFNPMGPTFESLCLSRIPVEGSYFIFLKLSHLFCSESTVYALMPESHDVGLLKSTLERIFAENGGEAPIFRDAPSFIFLPQEPIIDEPTLMNFFYLALKKADITGLDQSCLSLKKYWCNPWKRSADERDAGFEILTRTMNQTYKKRNCDTVDEKALDKFGENHAMPINRNLFHEWWSLVTNPQHIRSEISELPKAWQGATNFQNQITTNPLESIDVEKGLEFHYGLYQNNYSD